MQRETVPRHICRKRGQLVGFVEPMFVLGMASNVDVSDIVLRYYNSLNNLNGVTVCGLGDLQLQKDSRDGVISNSTSSNRSESTTMPSQHLTSTASFENWEESVPLDEVEETSVNLLKVAGEHYIWPRRCAPTIQRQNMIE